MAPTFVVPAQAAGRGWFDINPKAPDNEIVSVVLFADKVDAPPALSFGLTRAGDHIDPLFKDGFRTGSFTVGTRTKDTGCAVCADIMTADHRFMAVSGTLVIERIDRPVDPADGRIVGRLENVKFKRAHPVTGEPVEDGCETSVAQVAVDMPLKKNIMGTDDVPGAP